ncbi:MAG TPA: hypothetical protein PLS59_07705 [Kiritimatiellia bacterium]|nr:hypothetical protein [Kiritimatiellia bacterium]
MPVPTAGIISQGLAVAVGNVGLRDLGDEDLAAEAAEPIRRTLLMNFMEREAVSVDEVDANIGPRQRVVQREALPPVAHQHDQASSDRIDLDREPGATGGLLAAAAKPPSPTWGLKCQEDVVVSLRTGWGLGRPNGFAVERHDPVDRTREGRGAMLAGRPGRRSMGLIPLALRPGRAGRASGVTGLDGAWPGGAVPAGPPTSTRGFKRCDDPSEPSAGTVTTGSCPFQLLVGHPRNSNCVGQR